MRKIIAVILSMSLLLTLSGCRFSLKPTYWNGMTKQETEEFILDELEQKYGEEFEILKLNSISTGYIKAPHYLRGVCASKSDENLIFEIERWVNGEIEDTYIQAIVRQEMKEIIDSVLSEHYVNFASEVYVRGLANAYDSGIRSAADASIKTFTEALSENNSSSIWITFDKNEFEGNYETVDSILIEVVENFGLTRAAIDCYFVDSETVAQCQEKILNHHSGYSYRISTDMEVTLSSKRPVYCFVYNGGLWLDHFSDDTGIYFPIDTETNKKLD